MNYNNRDVKRLQSVKKKNSSNFEESCSAALIGCGTVVTGCGSLIVLFLMFLFLMAIIF